MTKREDDVFSGNGKAEVLADAENVGLLMRRDPAFALPRRDVRRGFAESASHRANAAEQCEDRGEPFHAHACAKKVHIKQAIICADGVQNFCMAGGVSTTVNARLKELRKSAIPALTIRGMADALGIGHSRYAYFEDPARFKKRELPLDLARQIAAVLAERNVDPAEVMKLAGLNEREVEPEAAAIEAARPQVQFVSLQLALPSEAALRDMFRSLLVLVPEGATKDEAAEILARRLPSGLAAIGPVVLDPMSVAEPAGGITPQSPATEYPAAAPPSRI